MTPTSPTSRLDINQHEYGPETYDSIDRRPAVFINYRRQGGAYAAALLDDRLSALVGRDVVFRASRSIGAGADYELAILEAVETSRAMLVVVDLGWLDAFTRSPNHREDWVRREIVGAYKSGLVVIPVLLAGVERISEESVPLDIAELARSQYLRFDYRNADQDALRIVDEIRRVAPDVFRKPLAEKLHLWTR